MLSMYQSQFDLGFFREGIIEAWAQIFRKLNLRPNQNKRHLQLKCLLCLIFFGRGDPGL